MQSTEDFQQQVLSRLDKLDREIQSLDLKQLESNTKIDAYQKASNQVVNLAFALISAATVTVIVSAVLQR
jgi:predicted PurR-regulated permease PerM